MNRCNLVLCAAVALAASLTTSAHAGELAGSGKLVDDGHSVRYEVSDSPSPKTTRIRLIANGRITWWKAVELKGDKTYRIETKDRHRESEMDIPSAELARQTVNLEIWAGGILGFAKCMRSVELSGDKLAGKMITIYYDKD